MDSAVFKDWSTDRSHCLDLPKLLSISKPINCFFLILISTLDFPSFFLTQVHSSVRGKEILGYTFIRPIKDLHQSKLNETKGCMRKIKREGDGRR